MYVFGYEIKKKPKKKKEFSKLIFTGVSLMVACVVIFSCVMIWRTSDLSPLAYLIPSVFVELATATGFYYKKAERENLNKFKTEGEIINNDD